MAKKDLSSYFMEQPDHENQPRHEFKETVLKCSKCGCVVTESDNFCERCGNPLKGTPAPASFAAPIPKTQVPPTAQGGFVPPAPSFQQPYYAPPKKKKFPFGFVIFGILVAWFVAIMYYGYVRYQEKTDLDDVIMELEVFAAAADQYFAENDCYWETGVASFGPLYEPLLNVKRYKFHYISNDNDGDTCDEADSFLYMAVPVDISEGKDIYYIDENYCLFTATVKTNYELETVRNINPSAVGWEDNSENLTISRLGSTGISFTITDSPVANSGGG